MIQVEEEKTALKLIWRIIVIVFTLFGILLSVDYIFGLRVFGTVILENSYFYLLIGLFVSLAFVFLPATRKQSAVRKTPPWYDVLFFVSTLVSCVYLAFNGYEIITRAWSFNAPLFPTLLSFVLWFLIIEAARRGAGLALALVCAFFSFYPVFASYMPGILEGLQFPLSTTATYHLMSTASVLGLPVQVVGTLIIGFILFGVFLQFTGGGQFFFDLASWLFGRTRGGPAKISVVSSALFGSMSGSVVSNVLTTGCITIPAMKKTGYPSYYAGAVEAVASTGGVLMPPVMGAVAFIMASFLGISYLEVVIAAIIPSILYYLCLFVQVDAYAAKTGMKGLSGEQRVSPRILLKDGWMYVLVFAVLLYFIFMRMEAASPFFAILALMVVALLRKETRSRLRNVTGLVITIGKSLTELMVICAAIGLIIGTFSVTGLGNSLSFEIVHLAGENLVLLLILGAFASFVLGMGMTVTACYVFLAIVLAPALVKIGLDPLATHLFIMYWGMLSFITPPVAVGAYVAAGLAGSSPARTGFQAMKLGVAAYLVPFFFVIQPALILKGTALEILQALPTAVIGVILMGGAIEGYLWGLRSLIPPRRIVLMASGVLLALPGTLTDILGAALLILIIVIHLLQRHRRKKVLETPY